jgi:hypothetical protein
MAYDASGEERFTRQEAPRSGETTRRGVPTQRAGNRGWYWLFVLPFVFTLFPPIYNRTSPEFIGMPFFYWYQTAWIVITAVITLIVYNKTRGS